MANPSVAEVTSAKSVIAGGVSWAVLGTPLPADARVALNAAFKGLGYIGPSGIQPAREISTDPKKDMNGDTVYVLQTDYSKTYQFELLQYRNVDVKKLIFGAANVTVVAATVSTGTIVTAVDRGEQQPHGAMVISTFDQLGRSRDIVEDAQVISVEEGPMVSTEVRSYTLTVTAYKNVDGEYVTHIDDDGVFAP